jgi:hypothetical protein
VRTETIVPIAEEQEFPPKALPAKVDGDPAVSERIVPATRPRETCEVRPHGSGHQRPNGRAPVFCALKGKPIKPAYGDEIQSVEPVNG